ncbi:transcriptional attenuator, LytR family [Thermoanaerobacter sp. YS13]|uniref:LCP family protein n=1 Tax=Thermoanaerobacter sp. YS13 TaxID=1511746 RepID=UPI000574A3C3|nr:LCP family protein [Thermoanaerobacter sp. YS13]KHO62722.1 transcriptional attenuator, LytR family [Thermoanaerobacter sp. YS13]
MKLFKILSFLLVGVIISTGIAALIFYRNIHVSAVQNGNPSSNIPSKNESFTQKNIVVIGSDENNLSDTLFIVNYNPENKSINILSIPRDTYYHRPGYNAPGDKKINAAFSEEGIEGTKKAIENLLGIKIDNYIILNYEGFKKVIDILGGVEVYVPFDMKYDDNSADPPLHIDLKKGWQVLNGEKAMEFVRYRYGYPDADLGRIRAQHQFLEAIFKKLTQPSILPKLPSLAITITKYVKTDLTASEITEYSYQFIKNKPFTVNTFTLPGEPGYKDGVSYFFADSTKIPEMVAKFLGKKNLLSNTSTGEENKNIRVEILNGTNIEGLASKYAEILKRQGFDVVRIGNVIGTTFFSSHVYARTNEEKAKKVANALSILSVEKDISHDSPVDVTVILGNDKSK